VSSSPAHHSLALVRNHNISTMHAYDSALLMQREVMGSN
jgi:hypothetical protein